MAWMVSEGREGGKMEDVGRGGTRGAGVKGGGGGCGEGDGYGGGRRGRGTLRGVRGGKGAVAGF